MGGDFYCRAHGNAVFEVEKPTTKIGIGIDTIPLSIRHSKVLTGNNLGQLGNVEAIPSNPELEEFLSNNTDIQNKISSYNGNKSLLENELHLIAKDLLEKGNVKDAWKILLLSQK
jgi:hypothetical protein